MLQKNPFNPEISQNLTYRQLNLECWINDRNKLHHLVLILLQTLFSWLNLIWIMCVVTA